MNARIAVCRLQEDVSSVLGHFEHKIVIDLSSGWVKFRVNFQVELTNRDSFFVQWTTFVQLVEEFKLAAFDIDPRDIDLL